MTIPSREELIQRLEETIQRLNETELSEHYIKPIREAAALLREEEWKKWPEEKPEKEGMYLVSEEGDVFDAHYDGLDWSDSNTNGPFEPDAWRTIPAFQPKTGEA